MYRKGRVETFLRTHHRPGRAGFHARPHHCGMIFVSHRDRSWPNTRARGIGKGGGENGLNLGRPSKENFAKLGPRGGPIGGAIPR